MKKYDGISIRSAASFREEARSALRGKWKISLLIFLVLMLMSGLIIGANCSYSTTEEIFPYYQLEASIGPFTTFSYWRNGELYQDAAAQVNSPFVLPFCPLFVAAAALTGLFLLILYPISTLAETRLSLNLLDGITPDFSVLRSTGREYWLFVRTLLLTILSILWPMLLCMIASAVLSGLLPDLDVLFILPVIAGFALLIIRSISYSAAFYLIVTRPDMTARKALKTSRQMMKGRKWRYVCLNLSFLGWDLLYAVFAGVLTGIFGETSLAYLASLLSVLALIPLYLYMHTASNAFLRDADLSMLGQTPADLVDALTSSESGEAPAPEASEQNAAEPTPDDPWADDGK